MSEQQSFDSPSPFDQQKQVVAGNQTNVAGDINADGGLVNTGTIETGGGDLVTGAKIIIQRLGSFKTLYWLGGLLALLILISIGVALFNAWRGGQQQEATQAQRDQLNTIGAVLLTPTATPTPVRVAGTLFTVAIAAFGTIDADGLVKPSALGADLSDLLVNGLREEYDQHVVESVSFSPGDVKIWHLADDQTARQIESGLIIGRTPVEREQAARDVAQAIGANMLVYGYLQAEEDPSSLEFFFYYDYPQLRDQPDAVGSRHDLGRALTWPRANPQRTKILLTDPLRRRADILFWLTLGLSYDVEGLEQKAFTIFKEAETALRTWPEDDGKEVLYYFIGRSALYQRNYDEALTAFAHAHDINPTYANALMGLGSVYWDRAQLFYLRDKPLPDDSAACTSAADIAAGAATPDEAFADTEQAIDHFQQALAVAPSANWSLIEPIAQLNLGLGHWLAGLAHRQNQENEQALAEFAESSQTISQTISVFQQANQVELVGHAYLALGIADFYAGNLYARTKRPAEARAAFTNALVAFDQCLALGDNEEANHFFRTKIIDCSCRPYRAEADKAVRNLGGGEG